MAHIPTNEEVKKLQDEAAKAVAKKIQAQKKQGKDFVENGQGVIPEAVWKTLPGKAK